MATDIILDTHEFRADTSLLAQWGGSENSIVTLAMKAL